MRNIILSLALLLASNIAGAQKALEVRTFTLSNGMEVWINEDHSRPTAYGAVVVKAGAKDCPGTGIAHYFEHIMFKGTEKIGTVDYAAEKPYLDSIAFKYDELAATSDDSLRTAIQMEINRLNIAASDFAVPNEFNNLISQCGGSDLNAYTSEDITVYHNQFLPSFFEQWAELNSERLIDPVFRLFQSELETVYEEKNRSDDNQFSAFYRLIFSEGFKDSPYQYDVIGTTESLKNPQLSQMKAFFDKYYVADNMGLMLTGDIDAEKALPVLEKTFGRIRRGEVKPAVPVSMAPYRGRMDVEALVKIPIVKINILCYRAPSKKEDDCLPLSFLSFMLNNSEGVGMLDKLITDHKISSAYCMYPDMAFTEAGLFPILIMPKILFQSSKKAEKHVLAVIDKVKSGDFSDEFFNSCKQTYRRNLVSGIENLESRMDEMVNAYAEDKNWADVVSEAEKIDAMTKEDLIAVANKYLCDDYLVISKKFGDPEKDNLQKPPYKKVVPKNTGGESQYAIAIKQSAAKVEMPRVVIDYEGGAERTALSDKVTLYTVGNELNDVFNLKFSYPVGTVEQPDLERLATYLSLVGSESEAYDAHREKLQSLGGSIGFSAGRNRFNISVYGFDENFDAIVALAADLLDNPASDKKKLDIIREDEISSKIMTRRDPSELSQALLQKVVYGDDSYYLKKKGKLDIKTLLAVLRQMQSNGFDVHYSGTLPKEKVAEVLSGCRFVGEAVESHPFYTDRKTAFAQAPGVYFVNKKKASQSQIFAIVPGEKIGDFTGRFSASVFGNYMGGGMGSVMFQEIREFRSMAYAAWATVSKPFYSDSSTEPLFFYVSVGTQSDKTIDAMAVVDSLLKNLPLDENRARMTAKDEWFARINAYPDFRGISYEIASSKRQGVDSDFAPYLYDLLSTYCADDVKSYWENNVAGRDIIWTVVGDSKKVSFDELSAFGKVVELKVGDIMK